MSSFSPPFLCSSSEKFLDDELHNTERKPPNDEPPPLFLNTLLGKKMAAEMRGAVFNLLARREQSQQELRVKLLRKFKKKYQNKSIGLISDMDDIINTENNELLGEHISEMVENLLEKLKEDGLQSDQKYREMLIRGRINQGQGFLRIAQELKHKKLAVTDSSLDNELIFLEAENSKLEEKLSQHLGRPIELPKSQEVVDADVPVFEANHKDWFTRARQVKQKKFGVAPAENVKERARQMRFLQYRGFSSDQIRFALNDTEDLPESGFDF